MLAFIFPGQGAQFKGMGRDLLESSLYSTELEAGVDALVGYSLRTICLEGSENELRRTEITQPCLYVVNALAYLRAVSEGYEPAFVAGHSLGEYNALFAAGAFDFLTGLKLVIRRGELMAAAPEGAMAAVLGFDAPSVSRVLHRHGLERVDIANLNTPTQVVISGPRDDVVAAETALREAGSAGFVRLQVAAPFHSRYMSEAAESFASFVSEVEFRSLERCVISNVTARPYPHEQTNEIRDLLARQIRSQVLWSSTIAYLKSRGVTEFMELGPGATLTRMLHQIPAPASALAPAPRDGEPRPCKGSRNERGITAASLGSEAFRRDHGVRYAYVAGSMYKAIASKEMVIAMARAGLLSYFGTGGLDPAEIQAAILHIRRHAPENAAYGMNLLHDPDDPVREERIVDIFLEHGIRYVEAAAYINVSPALVRYRLRGLEPGASGTCVRRHRILAKVSRPEVAATFMRPAPPDMVEALLRSGQISTTQAQLARQTPLADDICVESDSGGHTDGGVALTLLPTILLLRDEVSREYTRAPGLRVGAAGGIGTPHAAAAAFILGADFILTGSINQCTVESGTSDAVKDILEAVEEPDTAYAPAGDMFEYGAKMQVVRRGLFFHVRANKLFDLYIKHDAIEDIDPATIEQIEKRFFRKRIEEVWSETLEHYQNNGRIDVAQIESNKKQKMALVFKWYFAHTNRLAMCGSADQKVDYQIQCGPAMGAFNQWVKGTPLQSWRKRHVADLGERLMQGAAELLDQRFRQLMSCAQGSDEQRPHTCSG